jgi:hypothetical protein
MRRPIAIVLLSLFACALLGTRADAAVSVPVRYQLRGHLPELGEQPAMRVFLTQAAYDTFRTGLGDANVFPPTSSLFMSFEREFLALYSRGNDTGGRCIATAAVASFSGDTMTATFDWQSDTCGAPTTARHPFILVAVSRTASDGSTWQPSARQICAFVGSTATNACASFGGASSPSAAPSATTTTGAAPRSPTPTAVATASPAPSRSPIAAATPTSAPADSGGGPNLIVAAALLGLGVVIGLALMASRRPKTSSGYRR